MIKNRKILRFSTVFVSVLMTFSTVTVSADRVFKCKSEMATGFFLDNEDWKESSFELSDFVLTFDDDFKKMTISGEGSMGFTCRPHYNGRIRAVEKILLCDSNYRNGKSLRFNRKLASFLFISSLPSGYLSGEEGSENDVIYAGMCKLKR